MLPSLGELLHTASTFSSDICNIYRSNKSCKADQQLTERERERERESEQHIQALHLLHLAVNNWMVVLLLKLPITTSMSNMQRNPSILLLKPTLPGSQWPKWCPRCIYTSTCLTEYTEGHHTAVLCVIGFREVENPKLAAWGDMWASSVHHEHSVHSPCMLLFSTAAGSACATSAMVLTSVSTEPAPWNQPLLCI